MDEELSFVEPRKRATHLYNGGSDVTSLESAVRGIGIHRTPNGACVTTDDRDFEALELCVTAR